MTTSADDRRHRDLAAPLHERALWSQLPQFFQFVISRSLSEDLRPGHYQDAYKAETDVVGTFLLSLIVAGAFLRLTVHTELIGLTTSHLPIRREWFAIDAYKPRRSSSRTREPLKRQQKLRFPLPLLCRALLSRLVLFYETHATIESPPFPGDCGPHRIDLGQDNQLLFSLRIRTDQSFFSTWLAQAYRDFQDQSHQGSLIDLRDATDPDFPKFEDLMHASQIRCMEELPPWIVASLSQHWRSCPSQELDVHRILLGSDVQRHDDWKRDCSAPEQPLRKQTHSIPTIECSIEFPPPLQDIYSLVTGALHADMSKDERRAILDQIRQARRAFEAAVGSNVNGLLQNARYLIRWLEWVLSGRPLSPETILKYYKTLQVFIFYMFDDVCLKDIDDPEELIDIIAECMNYYDSPESQAAVRKSFQHFLNRMAKEGLIDRIKWNHPALRVYRDAKDRAVVSFCDVDKVLRDIDQSVQQRRISAEQAARDRIFIILCFYLGLRSREAVRLMLSDLSVTSFGIFLWVRRSKTRHGIRRLPVDLLIPEPYLTELVTFYRRATERAGPAQGAPFLSDDEGNFNRSSYYGKRIGKQMKKVLKFGSPHALRHGFATWFLVRSDFLLRGKPEQLQGAEFNHPVFDGPATNQFSFLLFNKSLSAVSRGERALARPISLLSTLIGHGCPEITLGIYAHSLDWIYYFALLRGGDNPTLLGAPGELGPRQAGNLLLQAPENQYGNGFVFAPTLRTIVELQQTQLGLASAPAKSPSNR